MYTSTACTWRYVTQSPQGRNAARVSGLCRVREGFLFLFLAPHPDRRGTVRLKLQVEIAVLGNSPCEIAVLRFKNGDFTRGIVDFGDFNPYFDMPGPGFRLFCRNMGAMRRLTHVQALQS